MGSRGGALGLSAWLGALRAFLRSTPRRSDLGSCGPVAILAYRSAARVAWLSSDCRRAVVGCRVAVAWLSTGCCRSVAKLSPSCRPPSLRCRRTVAKLSSPPRSIYWVWQPLLGKSSSRLPDRRPARLGGAPWGFSEPC